MLRSRWVPQHQFNLEVATLANRICNVSGCHGIVTKGGRCATDQPKDTRKPWARVSARNASRPSDWRRRRRFVLTRDRGVCYVCRRPGATEVDHVVPVARGGSHDYSNLKAICPTCHKVKTLTERRRAA
ncbi:HNH endonuclease signature motif containing protein [Nonomuraea sp. NPDC049141]|uniref:HNH endonuclease n=1 Tax=Nonomuraea sp. NPDC049141 TaxID=3155500 RepID=UPI0033D07C24